MTDGRTPVLALIVQSPPYRNRVARTEIDFALAAAALDFGIRVYFPGAAAMQLVVQRNPAVAGLPAGYRAWGALPDLAESRFFVEQRWFDLYQARKLDLAVPVEPLSAEDMRRTWRDSDHVLVL